MKISVKGNGGSMYYMTSERNGDVAYWEVCKAIELTAAKRECRRRYGQGFRDSMLVVSEVVGRDETGLPLLKTLARCPLTSSKWESVL